MIRVAITFLFIIQTTLSSAQSLSTKERWQLENALRLFLDANGAELSDNKTNRASEMFLLFLEVHTAAKISAVHLMIDAQNRDTVGAVLEKISANNFNTIILDSCKGKMLVLPITSLGVGDTPKDRTYTEIAFWEFLRSLQRPRKILKESGQLIILSPFVY